jgi:hypothetical protein
LAKKVEQEKMAEDPKNNFTEAHKEINCIFGGPASYESKRKQKLMSREVMSMGLMTPEYLKWSEVPITFNRSDHSDFIPQPGQYPLIVSPIIKDIKLNRVLIDRGRSLDILCLKMFNQMGLPRSTL